MSSILESLFYGSINPGESIHPKNKEYSNLNREISLFIHAYQRELSTEEFNKLEELIDLLGRRSTMDSAAAFVEGFRLGALMMVEVIDVGKKGRG